MQVGPSRSSRDASRDGLQGVAQRLAQIGPSRSAERYVGGEGAAADVGDVFGRDGHFRSRPVTLFFAWNFA